MSVNQHARLRSCIFAALVSLTAVLALAPGLALAAGANSAHGYIRPLGTGPGSEAGQLDLVAPISAERLGHVASDPQFGIAGSGVAASDKTHDVYVADTGNRRVDEFEADGTFVRAFGANVGGPGIDTCTLVPGCSKGATGSAPGALEAPKFVAVDNSPGPSRGDVYVSDGVGSEALNDLQFIEINGATKGTYTLTFEGKTTGPIEYTNNNYSPANDDGADAKAAQAALEELPVLKGKIKVRENGENGLEEITRGLLVEFEGALAQTAVPQLTADASGLTPGGTIEVNTAREGSHFAEESISKFNSDGELEVGWGDNGPDGTPNGQLGAKNGLYDGLTGIAVDPATGELWVSSTEVYQFGQEGKFNGGINLHSTPSASGIAVNDAGDLYAVTERNCVDEYDPSGSLIGCVSAEHRPDPSGFAFDTATGDVYAGLGSSIEQDDPSCLALKACEEFGPPQLHGGAGVAVDSSSGEPPFSGTVYAANTVSDQVDVFPVVLEVETGVASEITASGMTLSGKVNPEASEVGECYFEYGTSSEYEHNVPCEQTPAQIGSGSAFEEVHAKLKGLLGGTTYHFRLVATKGTTAVPGDDAQAGTPRGPVLSGEQATEVTAGGARLNGLLDPEGLPVTRCRFEYGTSTTDATAVPCEQKLAQLGTGTEPVPVSALLTGLSPNTTYYWRLSVRDANGEAVASAVEHTFVYPTTGAALPDGRAYEMVSPPAKDGASLGHTLSGVKYALAEDGSRVMMQSIQCFAEAQSCDADYEAEIGEPFEFTRTPSGWVTTALPPPAKQFTASADWLLGPDEGMALFSMPTLPGGENDWYLRSSEGSFQDIGPISPPSSGPTNFTVGIKEHLFESTADLSHLLWETRAGAPERWPFTEGRQQVLEYAGACGGHAECEATQPFPVGVTGGKGSTATIGGCETEMGGGTQDSNWNVISADGRTVYFTACGSGLYARVDGETSEAHTVAVSQPQCAGEPECVADEAHPSAAYFAGASADGSTAFFLDTQKLTPEATEGTGTAASGFCSQVSGTDCNLYESQCTSECERADEQRRLLDVSAAPDGDASGPDVLGVVATSPDGSHVYFVANGALVGGVRAGNCRYSGADFVGRCNLYVYERDARYPDGHLAFIATVPGADFANWTERNANVTPDGRFLVFKSSGDLTSDDARTDGDAQIFRYDADPSPEEAAAHVPQLIRISIGDDGFDDDGNAGVGAATIVPPENQFYRAGPARGDPTMSSDGSYVFFQSPLQLTPQAPKSDTVIGTDIEGGEIKAIYVQNVYEYHEGHVYLISDGSDTSATKGACEERIPTGDPVEIFESATCLLGTDASGKDVFFTTADQLVPADTDTQTDVYDARVCEPANGNPCITEPPPPLPPCLGEQCHGIPAATPSLLAPGTASFNGEGNLAPAAAVKPKAKVLTRAQKLAKALKACGKDRRPKKRAACEKAARAKYGARAKKR